MNKPTEEELNRLVEETCKTRPMLLGGMSVGSKWFRQEVILKIVDAYQRARESHLRECRRLVMVDLASQGVLFEPDEWKQTIAAPPDTKLNRRLVQEPSSAALLRQWITKQNGDFTIGDFRDYLVRERPDVPFTESGIRTAFHQAAQAGQIRTVVKGSGRRAHVYCTVTEP